MSFDKLRDDTAGTTVRYRCLSHSVAGRNQRTQSERRRCTLRITQPKYLRRVIKRISEPKYCRTWLRTVSYGSEKRAGCGKIRLSQTVTKLMQSSRAHRAWNVLSLLAVALWLAPALAWTCPKRGVIADSPDQAMRLANNSRCASAPVVAPEKNCAACPLPAHSSEHSDDFAEGAPHPLGGCCLAAWLPDAGRFGQRSDVGQAPALALESFKLAQPTYVLQPLCAVNVDTPRIVARAGPNAPRGPPAVQA